MSGTVPGDFYKKSNRPYSGLKEISYPLHDKEVTVTNCGRICMNGKKINITQSLAGQKVGIKEVSDGIWLVSFMEYDLGYFDEDWKRLEPLSNPF